MARIGRNEPCPCGSGKKYKQCCAVASEEEDRVLLAVRRTEGAAVASVIDLVRARYGAELVEMAWSDFVGAEDLEPLDPELPEFESTFFPWLVCNWVPRHWTVTGDAAADDAPPLPQRPLALEYLDEPGVAPVVQRFLRAACAEPFSFFAVQAAVPGRSLTLRDILSGREVTVAERRGSSVAPGTILYTRVLTVDGLSIQFGCAPLAIPPSHHLRLIDLREAVAPGRLLEREELLALDDELRAIYWAIVDEVDDPALPALHNSDGDPLRLITLHYALACSVAEALAALRGLAGDSADRVKRARDGSVKEVHLSWLRQGAAPPRAATGAGLTLSSVRIPSSGASGESGPRPTILGSLTIRPDRLTVEVNSERRAEAARAEIEARLGPLARFERAESEDPEAALAARSERPPTDEALRAREESKRLAALPEVQAHLRAMLEAHYEGWVDTPLPALGGQTPRAAVRSPVGRERVEALLAQLAWRAEDDPARRPDIAALRRRLGLDS